jgi:fluoroquinolone transport system permease protein
MRFWRILSGDMRYQFKYGFYFLYLVISAFYIAVLLLLPPGIRQLGAALIIWSDPAGLGFFFIGGIVLLEKGEGLHSYFSILPVTTGEYLWSKVLSLSVISTLAGLVIAAAGLRGEVGYLYLVPGLLAGSALFTLFGLAVGSVARSVNHYMALGVPVGIVLLGPSFLPVLGVSHPLLELLPATLLLRALYVAAGLAVPYSAPLTLAGLLLWLVPAYWLAQRSFTIYLQRTGG